MSIFSLNEVVSLQIENVSNNNFSSWTEEPTKGYHLGGSKKESPDGTTNLCQTFVFATETAMTSPFTLLAGMRGSSTFETPDHGYIANGIDGSTPNVRTSKVDRLEYSTETISFITNMPDPAISSGAPVQNTSYGYNIGGTEGPDEVDYVRRIEFSTNTTSSPGTNYFSAQSSIGSVTKNDTAYLIGGGTAPERINIRKKYDLLTETFSNYPNNPYAAEDISAVRRSTHGYVVGGQNSLTPVIYSSVQKVDFEADTFATLPPTPSTIAEAGVYSNHNYGYFSSGYTTLPSTDGRSSKIFRTDFQTETFTEMSTVMPFSSNAAASVSGAISKRNPKYKNYGYLNTLTNYIRVDLSTETSTNTSTTNTTGARSRGCINSIDNAYFGGGTVPPSTTISKVSKLDFTTESHTDLGPNSLINLYLNYTPSQQEFSKLSSNLMGSNYGYFCGGVRSPNIEPSNILKLDFTTDSLVDTRANTPYYGTFSQNFSKGSYGYIMGGYYFDPASSGGPGNDEYVSTIHKMDFTTETFENVGSWALGLQRASRATTQSSGYGYLTGASYPNINTTYRYDFSTESIQTLPSASNYGSRGSSIIGLSSEVDGYLCGGLDPTVGPPNLISDIYKLDFSTEAVSDTTNNLPAVHQDHGSCVNGTPN